MIVTSDQFATWSRTARPHIFFLPFFPWGERPQHICVAYTAGTGETWSTRSSAKKRQIHRGRKKRGKSGQGSPTQHALTNIIPLAQTDGYGGLPIKYTLTHLACANPPLTPLPSSSSSLSSWRTGFFLLIMRLNYSQHDILRIAYACTDKATSDYCWFVSNSVFI